MIGLHIQVIYEDTVCDNIDELTRATCAAIFGCLVYQNIPQEDPESSPDQVASVFLSLALNSVSAWRFNRYSHLSLRPSRLSGVPLAALKNAH